MEHKINPTEKRELWQPSAVAVREAADGGEAYIEGDAIMCGVETILYEDEDLREIEVIDSSCIRQEFIDQQEMFINVQHDRNRTFGKLGKNLSVEVRADRLSCRCTGTSALFNETRALINDGVYCGMSFEFWPDEYKTEKRTGADGKTEYLIRHTAFRAIGALTVASQPAYKQTSVSARELYREQHSEHATAPNDDEKREQELIAAAERERFTLEARSRVMCSIEAALAESEIN